MKFELNKKYNTIALYVMVVVAASVLFYFGVRNLEQVKGYLGGVLGLVTPFIYGGVLAYILNPVLNWLEGKAFPVLFRDKVSRRARRGIGVLLCLLFGISVVALFLAILIPQISDSVNSLVRGIIAFTPKAQAFLNELTLLYNDNPMVEEILSLLGSSAESIISYARTLLEQGYMWAKDALPSIFGGAMKVTYGLLDVVVGIIISIYLLLSKELFYAQCKKLAFAILPRNFVRASIKLAHDSNDIFCGFISGKIVDSAIIGVLCFLGTSLLQMPYAVLVSVIVGVTNVIPYFGPFIGAIPSIFIIAIASPVKALYFAVFILLLQQLDGNVIGPKILGDSTGLSAFWVIFAVTFFGGIWGFVGMLIGVPLFAVIYSLVRNFAEYRLTLKGMDTATDAYASPGQEILRKGQKPKHHASSRSLPPSQPSQTGGEDSDQPSGK